MMDFAALNRSLQRARWARNFFAGTTALAICSTLMLAYSVSSVTKTTVLVPSRISDGMVSNGDVDVRYMEAIALDAVFAFFNLSPQTSDYSRSAIEKIAGVRARPDLLEAFDEVSADIKARRLTTTFFVREIHHDWANLEVTVVGHLSTFIETKIADREERTVRLRFVREASSVRLASLNVLEVES